MLVDALKAEGFRFWRDRGAVFWGFAFPGVGTFLLGVIGSLIVKAVTKAPLPGLVDLGREVLESLSGAGSPITQLFFILGAAAIFGADYRWETWRIQTPRNSRLNLILAKFAVFAVSAFLALLGMALGGVLSAVIRALIEGLPFTPVDMAVWLPLVGRSLLAAWLELMVVGGVAALIAVLTRTTVAAIIVTLLLTFAQAIIMGVVRPNPLNPDWDMMASFPALSAQVLRGGPVGIGGAEAQGAPLGLLFLLIWIGVLGGATILAFQRQELTRE